MKDNTTKSTQSVPIPGTVECPKFGDTIRKAVCAYRQEIYHDVGAMNCRNCEHDSERWKNEAS